MKLYMIPPGPPSQVVLTTIYQHGWEDKFEFQFMMPDGKANKTEEFLALNPRGQIPTLQDGDTGISEGNAIVRYIHAKIGENSDFWPTDALERTKIEVQIAHETANLRKVHGALYYAGFIGPLFRGAEKPSAEELKKL